MKFFGVFSLFIFHKWDISLQNETLATFEDDTALMDTENDLIISTDKVQTASNGLLRMTNQSKMRPNLTNEKLVDPPKLYLNGITVCNENNA